jgi:redox-sensitive bicupin YhaK (pirin superfamily)
MSWQLVTNNGEEDSPQDIEMVILPRTGDIGGFEVQRALPFRHRRLVGPFVFWDQMGPGEFLTGQGVDVRPHPHIGLSTVTYLFDGSLDHRDSLGTFCTITPGDVNLMTAGSGIVHSERTGQDVRLGPSRLYGIQSWVATPKALEEGAPRFHHQPKAELPTWSFEGVQGRLLMGDFQGLRSPVPTDWQTVYADIDMQRGARISVPPEHEERALYLLQGDVVVAGVPFSPGRMLVLKPGRSVDLTAQTPARVLLLGGATMDGPRYIWWNFVSSSRDRIEEAKKAWAAGAFPAVPGETEHTPLPTQ